MTQRKIRVLIVDDSSLIRQILTTGLEQDEGIEVVASAQDPYDARDKIVKFKPDVVTLDVEMPKMTGVEFLKKLMPQFPVPVVMVSSLTERGVGITLEALASGAVDFVTKPKGTSASSVAAMLSELRAKIKIAAVANVSHWKKNRDEIFAPTARLSNNVRGDKVKLIAIGASTGGTEAIASILRVLPVNIPGIVIVQHMPAGFTKLFADRVNNDSLLEVREAKSGDLVLPGQALLAPGGFQCRVSGRANNLQVTTSDEGKMDGHCPSVNTLFNSVAACCADRTIGIILTGMGQDGAVGLKAMRDRGSKTIGQNEATCVVYGMPKVAYENGGVEELVSLQNIPQKILSLLKE